MKKLLSFLMAVSMVACLLVPVVSAEKVVYNEEMYQDFEEAADIADMYTWDITPEFSEDGVFGSAGAAKVNLKTTNGGPEYRMNLTMGKMYRFSAYVKPLDFDLTSSTLILLTESTEGGKSGWESVPMKVGAATDDGYIPISVEYRISDRVYPGGNADGSIGTPLVKNEGAHTRVVFRVNKANVNYLIDEIKVEPTDYVAFENFDIAGNIPAIVTQPTTATDGTSETFDACILAHSQAYYTATQNGTAHIAGSGTKGAYFPNLTLMPITTYRISADIKTSPNYDVTLYPYYKLSTTQSVTLVPAGDNTFGSGIQVAKGTTQHVEFLFRTEGASTKAYAEEGITFDKFGIASKDTYVIYDIDNFKVEKVDEPIIRNGDMENVTLNNANTKMLSNAVNANGLAPVMHADGNDATLELVQDDGTNADRGDYVLLHCVGTKSANATNENNNRRAVWYVNLKKATTYRISFWAKVVTDDDTATYTMEGMHNMSKVDANGLVSGEEGFDAGTSAYGYISNVRKFKLNNQWQHVDFEYTTQNRQQIAQILLGVSSFRPEGDVTVAFDEMVVEDIGTGYYGASAVYANGIVTATENTGAQIGEVTGKTYTFYVSEDNESFARLGESADGTWATNGLAGKYVKAVVSATKADGEVVSNETNAVRIPGFALKFTSGLEETVTASAIYYPEADEVKTFDGIIALYNGKELVAADSFTSENNVATMSVANDGTATSAKIFAWSSLGSAIPVAKTVELN